jgi:hypothetical protein
MALGSFFGILAYRSAYASILDSRYNHIPLPPFATKTRLSYSAGDSVRCTHLLEGRHLEGADKMVVWSWWKQSVPSDLDTVKEILWLQSLWRLKLVGTSSGTGKELYSIIPRCKTSSFGCQRNGTTIQRQVQNANVSDEHTQTPDLSCPPNPRCGPTNNKSGTHSTRSSHI